MFCISGNPKFQLRPLLQDSWGFLSNKSQNLPPGLSFWPPTGAFLPPICSCNAICGTLGIVFTPEKWWFEKSYVGRYHGSGAPFLPVQLLLWRTILPSKREKYSSITFLLRGYFPICFLHFSNVFFAIFQWVFTLFQCFFTFYPLFVPGCFQGCSTKFRSSGKAASGYLLEWAAIIKNRCFGWYLKVF